MTRDVLPGVTRIAVLRANGLGDFIFTLPALEALRRAYPEAEIVLLGKAWHADFLRGRSGPVDRVVTVPVAAGVGAPETAAGEPGELAHFFREMRAERFDLALQLHGGGRFSNPFVKRLGARVTAGLKAADSEPLDLWVPYIYFQPEVFRFLEVVALVGARAGGWEPRLTANEVDLDEAARFVPQSGAAPAVLHLGAGDPRRRWPAERFAAVGDALAKAGALVVLNGTGDERPVVDAVRAQMRHRAVDLGADCSLARLAGVLSRAAVVVSCDSGPLHLARAVGAATVGIYWCGNLVNAGPTTRTRHRPFVSWRLQCSVCGTNTMTGSCHHDASFVDEVAAEDVAATAVELLALARHRTHPGTQPTAATAARPARAEPAASPGLAAASNNRLPPPP